MLDKGIVHPGNVLYAPVFEKNLYMFFCRIVGCIAGLSCKRKVGSLVRRDAQVLTNFIPQQRQLSILKRTCLEFNF